jgi:hypothetical protein
VRIPALTAGLVALCGTAHAADCAQPFSTEDLLSSLNRIENAAQGGDASGALAAANQLQSGLGCMTERLMPTLVVRTLRSLGAGFVVGGDEARGAAWFRTAIELDPQFEFGVEEFPSDHPVSRMYRGMRETLPPADPIVAPRAFLDGKYYLDGRTLREPAATDGRPHLLQQDRGGVSSWVIEGAAFPDSVLVAPVAVAAPGKVKEPKAKEPKDKAPAPSASGAYVRVRPPEKTPLIIGGAAIVLGAGAMYGGAILSRQKFDGVSDSEADLRRAQLTTNRLYLGSIALLAVGVGTTTWGVILDGGTPMPHVRVRF